MVELPQFVKYYQMVKLPQFLKHYQMVFEEVSYHFKVNYQIFLLIFLNSEHQNYY